MNRPVFIIHSRIYIYISIRLIFQCVHLVVKRGNHPSCSDRVHCVCGMSGTLSERNQICTNPEWDGSIVQIVFLSSPFLVFLDHTMRPTPDNCTNQSPYPMFHFSNVKWTTINMPPGFGYAMWTCYIPCSQQHPGARHRHDQFGNPTPMRRNFRFSLRNNRNIPFDYVKFYKVRKSDRINHVRATTPILWGNKN
jgi:hypothetical protein